MDITPMAKDFVDMLKKGQHHEAAAKYNSDAIASYEAMDGQFAICRGKADLAKKGEWWVNSHEVHGGTVEGPYVNGSQFAVRFTFDVTVKESGKRLALDEIGVYTVQVGKIVEERFFYLMP